jgi:hypothetical protein
VKFFLALGFDESNGRNEVMNMDADKVTIFKQLIADMDDPESLLTLRAMRDVVDTQLGAIQFDLMLSWAQQGWGKNPPGLVCPTCGSSTFGREDGGIEYVKCTNMLCGITHQVRVR